MSFSNKRDFVRQTRLAQQDASACYLAPNSRSAGNGEVAMWKPLSAKLATSRLIARLRDHRHSFCNDFAAEF